MRHDFLICKVSPGKHTLDFNAHEFYVKNIVHKIIVLYLLVHHCL